jgi:hypothetical protein
LWGKGDNGKRRMIMMMMSWKEIASTMLPHLLAHKFISFVSPNIKEREEKAAGEEEKRGKETCREFG